MKPLWGVNEEGEINGCYPRDVGLWYIIVLPGALVLIRMTGNFGSISFHSKHMALREFLLSVLI
jgi:hypothetical protein